MHDAVLVIFTMILQCAIGLMIFVAITKALNINAACKVAVLTAAVFSIVGVFTSLLHLGNPTYAFLSITGIKTSWLSMEILCTSVFAGLTILTALSILYGKISIKFIRLITITAAIIGFIDVAVMAKLYHFTSIPGWEFGATFIQFYTVAVSVGAGMFLILAPKEAEMIKTPIVILVGIAISIEVIAMIDYYIKLGSSSNFVIQKNAVLLNDFYMSLISQWFFILMGTGLIFVSSKQKHMEDVGLTDLELTSKENLAMGRCSTIKSKNILLLGVGTLLVGQVIGRFLFFSLSAIRYLS